MAWHEDQRKLNDFQEALSEAGYLEDADEVREFYKKPYKFDSEFEAWAANGYPSDESEDGWEDFVNAISSDEDDTETEET